MSFSLKTESPLSENSRFEGVKWLLVLLLIAGVFVANAFLPDQTATLRLLWNLIAGLVILSLVSFTQKGKQAWTFAKDARIELRKVVWPTRQEAIQSTLMIIVVVIVTSLFLWGVDSILMWAISFMTGQRG